MSIFKESAAGLKVAAAAYGTGNITLTPQECVEITEEVADLHTQIMNLLTSWRIASGVCTPNPTILETE